MTITTQTKDKVTSNPRTTPDRETTFLVSGGGKGITAENAVALAAAHGSRFLLLGSSTLLEEEPAWAEEIEEPAELTAAAARSLAADGSDPSPQQVSREARRVASSREIRSTLERVRAAGGQAEYLSADLRDPAALKAVLEPYRGEINAVLHGAGALADKKIGAKLAGDFDLVYGVKADGLRHILSVLPPEDLDFLILFSSVAGFYGNAGQADYSLANEVLNKAAHYLAHTYPDLQVLAVDWGPWDGGMVTPQLKRILTRRNVDLISLPRGTQTTLNLLQGDQRPPQVVVGHPLPFPPASPGDSLDTHHLHRELTLENNPFLEDHVIGGRAVLPTVCAVGWMVNGGEGLFPGYQFHRVSGYRVYKGILFDESLADHHTLEIKELEKGGGRVRYRARITSQKGDGQGQNHYQAEIELRTALPEPPRLEDINVTHEVDLSGKGLYGDGTLFHGPRFQGVQEVLHHSREGITMRCQSEPIPRVEQGQFPVKTFNPYLADVHLQSLLIWASLYQDVKGLPLEIAGGTQYRTLDFGTTSYATMLVNSSSRHQLSADVITHDQDGLIYHRVEDAQITLSKRLNQLFLDNQLKVEE